MTHGGAEVGGADEHTIHPFDRGNLIQPGQAFEVFDLHQQTHLRVSLIQVPGNAVPARSAGQGAADPTHTARWIVNGTYQLAGLSGAFHHRHQQGLGADVENLFDQRGITDHWADDRL
ncbi:hypothetical protein D3C81_1751880 [compost metagenome]